MIGVIDEVRSLSKMGKSPHMARANKAEYNMKAMIQELPILLTSSTFIDFLI